jgi:2-methylcitrate dehydratase PrpD
MPEATLDVLEQPTASCFTDNALAFLADFDLGTAPAEAIRRATDAITDTLGCAVLGARQDLEPRLRSALFGDIRAAALANELAPATLARGRQDAQGTAALYLGALAHAADFDDISHPAYCHATALLLPALLVRGAVLGRSGRDLLDAYLVGVEVLGQLGRQIDKDETPAWHPTSMLGTIGATAALCRLERLPTPTARAALSIAASMACGVRENFGTMTKPVHCGFPGRSAILATRLAASGLTSAARGVDGRHGMLEVFARLAPWGAKPWGAPLEVMTETGLALKAYPSCAATHPAIDASRALAARLDVASVVRVRVGMSRYALRPLIYEWPETPLEAKFSLRHCVATALLDREVTLASFEPASIARPALRRLMELVEYGPDERVIDDREFAAVVRVELADGRAQEERVDVASGKPGNWLTAEHLARKFRDCAGEGARAMALHGLAQRVAEDVSVAALLSALAASLAEAASDRP